ncbi:enolase C-terminal domain-like protein [Clavibacter zhangzhiyongii]|uniref:enolase C-terminal domain-like protein n=1 Tax=Clavibacter zhangzhiyongii TaxID=2768071 RepID=UPI001F27B93C|nr:enolase C-terminal domain-like protein [Clavibacter zhangzhiyongii]
MSGGEHEIVSVRLRRLEGTLPTPEGDLWEDWLVRPADVYPDIRDGAYVEGGVQGPDGFRIETHFLEVATRGGLIGIAGPVTRTVAFLIASDLRGLLVGRDALATERLWDVMHRTHVHGRQGQTMLAISAVDAALWDLRGRSAGLPVHRLLGGPTRDAVPAYASMLGYSTTDLELVFRRAREFRDRGYAAQKWFFRYGPSSGYEGMRANVDLVRVLREAVGEDYDLMLDCWQSFDETYATELARRIEVYRPRWLEEPLMPDRIDGYGRLRRRIGMPVAGAEHEYTRWGVKRFLDAEALDVIQPDVYWCGGLSETVKIAALASAYDVMTIPHGHSAPATLQFSLAQSPASTPMQEDLVKWNRVHQLFLADPVEPEGGVIHAGGRVGMGMDLDLARAESDAHVFE